MESALYCTRCGHAGNPRTITPGSRILELLLWCFFLIPGLIYTTWRSSVSRQGCPYCSADAMVPLDSPAAQNATIRPNDLEVASYENKGETIVKVIAFAIIMLVILRACN
jgi:hypothetical protein